MPIYQYEAIGANAQSTRGAIDAESLADAKQKLLNQSLFLLSIRQVKAQDKRPLMKKRELLRFTRELSRLLKAGLPLYESLRAMEEKYRGHKIQNLLLHLAEQVRSGEPLSAALARHPATFDLIFVALIANAEQTGFLSGAFEELSNLLVKQQAVRKQLTNAFLYPAFLFGFCLLVLSTLLFYVVPSLQELFESRQLHPMTQIVFWLSNALRGSKVFWLSALTAAALSGLGFWLQPRRRKWFAERFFRMPGVRDILAKAALVRFCRAAATLLEGSVPIVDALRQASTVLRHPILRPAIDEAAEAIRQGKPIDEAFQGRPLIPPLVPRMLGIAKEGGNLAPTFQHLGEIYEEDLQQLLTLFSSIAQPALLLFLGAVIGVVLLSVLIPLTDVSSFAAN